MKKIAAAVLASIALVVVLTGCSDDIPTGASGSSTKTVTTKTMVERIDSDPETMHITECVITTINDSSTTECDTVVELVLRQSGDTDPEWVIE